MRYKNFRSMSGEHALQEIQCFQFDVGYRALIPIQIFTFGNLFDTDTLKVVKTFKTLTYERQNSNPGNRRPIESLRHPGII